MVQIKSRKNYLNTVELGHNNHGCNGFTAIMNKDCYIFWLQLSNSQHKA